MEEQENKVSLYKIHQSIEMIENMDIEDMQVYLDSVNLQRDEKVDNIIKFSRSLETTSAAIDIEIKRLTDLKNSLSKKSKWLLDYVKFVMEKFDIESIQTSVSRLSFRRAKSVYITDETKIPAKYLNEKTTVTVNKTLIAEDLKAGVEIPGVEFIENKHLQVK